MNVHTRHSKFHGTQKMVIKGGYIDSLVDHNMKAFPSEGVTVTKCSSNSSIGICA